jgi:hypothetical protein
VWLESFLWLVAEQVSVTLWWGAFAARDKIAATLAAQSRKTQQFMAWRRCC